jgi:hypothetical protein
MSKTTAPDLSDIPHASSTAPQTLDVLETILTDDHVGENNAITSDALAAAVGEHSRHDTNPAIRDAVRDLLFDRGVPVASCNAGYYIPADESGIDGEVESIRGRIGELNKRKLAFEAAAEGWDFGTHESDHAPPDTAEPTTACTAPGCSATVPKSDWHHIEDHDGVVCKSCYGDWLINGKSFDGGGVDG